MKKTIPVIVFLLFSINLLNAAPKISFEDIMANAEMNPSSVVQSRQMAVVLGIPVTVYSKDNVIADLKGTENGMPVYAVITNFANIYDGGYTAYYEELLTKINFSNSKLVFGNGQITDNTQGYFEPKISGRMTPGKYLLVAESSSDRVYIFNADNGDLIDTIFVPSTRPALQTPKHAIQHFNGSDILVADQISDVVQRFRNNGTYMNIFAPAGGVNNAILDNIRSATYMANNDLLVTVGSGASINTVQRFDTAGNSLGTFIPTGNINSPFDVLIRTSDLLVSNFSGTNRISRFDQSGNFIASFYTGSNFGLPEQLQKLPNETVSAAAFGSPSGIAFLDSSGTFRRLINAVTGLRGLHMLSNGNFLVTNGSGIHEIDTTTGTLVRTIYTSTGFQYISEYNTSNPQVRLTINFEACNAQDTLVLEARNSASPYAIVESSTGMGGQGVPYMFNFSTIANNVTYYFAVNHRNSIATWSGTVQSLNSNYDNFNFTYAATQAYGSNMVNVGGKWSIYTGDVNLDETVDLSDITLIFNDAGIFASGYIVTDLNCDAIADLTDITFCFNNSTFFVSVVKP